MPNSTGDRKSRVLIVDDAPANLAILDQALAWDYEVSVATRGEDALRIVASQSTPDRVPMLLT